MQDKSEERVVDTSFELIVNGGVVGIGDDTQGAMVRETGLA